MNKQSWGREAVSNIADKYRAVVPNPLVQALLIGGAGYGISRVGWGRIVETARSLGRAPLRRMSGLSNEEYDEAMDNLKTHPTYRYAVPAAVGAILGGLSLVPAWNTGEGWNGLTSWYPDAKLTERTGTRGTMSPGVGGMSKPAMLKKANDFFNMTGYVPDIDWSKTFNASELRDITSNDPNLAAYPRNEMNAIVNNTVNMSGSNHPTFSDLYASAAQKIDNKLSWNGVANIAARTMLSNTASRLLVNAVDAIVGIDPNVKRNIVDAGTWAGAITSILS